MKYKLLLSVITTLILLGCNSSSNDADKTAFKIDSNVKKKIMHMVYEALPPNEYPQKGTAVYYADDFFSYSQSYYDSYDNKLYEEFFSFEEKEKGELYMTERTIWYDSESNKKKAMIKTRFTNDRISSMIDYEYIRNTEGYLTHITESEWHKYGGVEKERQILSEHKYDNSGNRIETIDYFDNNIENKTIYLHFNNDKEPMSYVVYDADNQLSEKSNTEYYPDGAIKSEHFIRYKYGKIREDTKLNYSFDTNGNMLTKTMESYSLGSIRLPSHINTKEDKDNYIKENYYDNNYNLKHTSIHVTYTYDEYNNCTHSCLYDYSHDGNLLSHRKEPCEEKERYKYNSRGDWIEKISFYNGVPRFIVTRDIEYFE